MLSADEYRAIFESSPDGCLVVDAEGHIRDLNPQIESLFGWTREELLGSDIELLVPEILRGAHAGYRATYGSDPHNRPMGVGLDLRAQRKDGTTFPVEISLSPWHRNADDMRIICTVRDVTEHVRLRDFSEGALRASEEERQRIARELHDDTAQRLATLILRVRVLAEERNAGMRRRLLDQIRAEIVEASEGVKRIARGLRPPELEEVGLALALRAHVRGLREGTGFEVDADLDFVDPYLTLTAKLALYRIVQEALSNVLRHAGTGRATLKLFLENGKVVAEVRDEGVGFHPGRATEGGAGLGLVGMRERVTMIGGRLAIHSTPGAGTRVRVDVPANTTETVNG